MQEHHQGESKSGSISKEASVPVPTAATGTSKVSAAAPKNKADTKATTAKAISSKKNKEKVSKKDKGKEKIKKRRLPRRSVFSLLVFERSFLKVTDFKLSLKVTDLNSSLKVTHFKLSLKVTDAC